MNIKKIFKHLDRIRPDLEKHYLKRIEKLEDRCCFHCFRCNDLKQLCRKTSDIDLYRSRFEEAEKHYRLYMRFRIRCCRAYRILDLIRSYK